MYTVLSELHLHVRFLTELVMHVRFLEWIVHACAASDFRKARAAQRLAGASQNSTQDDGCMEEVRVKVAALYEVAYSKRCNENGVALSEQELIMRMALPWHIAPRQLGALISRAVQQQQQGTSKSGSSGSSKKAKSKR
jgi:hypothetical protein